MKRILALLLAALALVSGAAHANEGGIPWDPFPREKVYDNASLQNGAKLFVNYCLNCHAATFMRYNRLRDIGLTEDQIKKNLMFAGDKVGEVMKTSLDPKQAKDWFGAVPPDLTVIARSRADGAKGTGADYLYTYLRSYYRDETKATGWNNLVFPSVSMPHVLWQLQGVRRAVFVEEADPHDHARKVEVFKGFEQVSEGTLKQFEFDNQVADLVAFLQWMGEPKQNDRVQLGVWVLIFLAFFTFIAWRLNAAFWKDVN